MKKRIVQCAGQEVPYTLKRYKRQRCIRLISRHDGSLTVTAPWWVRVREVEAFVEDRKAWIEKHVVSLQKKVYSEEEKSAYKRLARGRVESALERLNSLYGFSYNRISIRESRAQWGSCSIKKNLSFSWRVALLEDELLEYIVAHELCHLEEMNHSQNFWKLVSRSIPDHLERRQSLRNRVI